MNTPFTLPTPAESPFRVPEQYFSDFTSRMMARIPEAKSVEKPHSRSLWQTLRPYLSAAAVVAVVALGTKALQRTTPAPGYGMETQYSAASIDQADSQDEFYSYLMLDDQTIYAYQDEQ